MIVGVTGHTGRLGKVLVGNGCYPCGLDNAHEFDVIIHAAAYTDVDKAEIEIAECFKSNVVFTGDLRKATDAKIIYISTDFVFKGLIGPYIETNPVSPISIYGLSKQLGERCLWDSDLIVRTTVLYDSHKPDFVTWVLNELKENSTVSVSDSMITSPTNVWHLTEALLWLVENPIERQVINIAGNTVLSRYWFAALIADVFGYNWMDVLPTEQVVFGKAKRPIRAGLLTAIARDLGIPLYSPRAGLELMKKENKYVRHLRNG